MVITIFKLDNPSDKYSWWRKDIVVKCRHDLEKISGFSGNNVFGKITFSDVADSEELVAIVEQILAMTNTKTECEMINLLYEIGVIHEKTRLAGSKVL